MVGAGFEHFINARRYAEDLRPAQGGGRASGRFDRV
jgi:hypothetical protein